MTAVRVLHITDTHLVGDPSGRQRGVVVLDSLRAVLAQGLRERPDVILLTGDIVHDDPRGYRWLPGVFEPRTPVLCIPGNHDDPEAMRRALSDAPFRLGDHHDIGAWRIVMLDSQRIGEVGGRLSAHELHRLDRALTEAPARHALVVLHHPPIAMGSLWLDEIGLENPTEFFAVIDRHAQTKGVLWGHAHQALDKERPGPQGSLKLMATPSTCVQFRPRAADFEIDDHPPGYRMLTLHPDGRIETTVGWLE
jgi:Icc protein